MAESVGLGSLLSVDLECKPLGLVVVLRPVVVGTGHHRGLQFRARTFLVGASAPPPSASDSLKCPAGVCKVPGGSIKLMGK